MRTAVRVRSTGVSVKPGYSLTSRSFTLKLHRQVREYRKAHCPKSATNLQFPLKELGCLCGSTDTRPWTNSTMHTIRNALLFTALLTTACAPAADTRADSSGSTTTVSPALPSATDSNTAQWIVTERGIGSIIGGMTIDEASTAAGATLIPKDGAAPGSTCMYLEWPGGPAGVRLMSENARVVRVDVEDSTVTTREGARVGDSAERITTLYDGRVADTPHKYTSGRYLTVTPTSPADSAYRMVFEVENGRVTRFRSGIRPAVEYVEGCG